MAQQEAIAKIHNFQLPDLYFYLFPDDTNRDDLMLTANINVGANGDLIFGFDYKQNLENIQRIEISITKFKSSHKKLLTNSRISKFLNQWEENQNMSIDNKTWSELDENVRLYMSAFKFANYCQSMESNQICYVRLTQDRTLYPYNDTNFSVELITKTEIHHDTQYATVDDLRNHIHSLINHWRAASLNTSELILHLFRWLNQMICQKRLVRDFQSGITVENLMDIVRELNIFNEGQRLECGPLRILNDTVFVHCIKVLIGTVTYSYIPYSRFQVFKRRLKEISLHHLQFTGLDRNDRASEDYEIVLWIQSKINQNKKEILRYFFTNFTNTYSCFGSWKNTPSRMKLMRKEFSSIIQNENKAELTANGNEIGEFYDNNIQNIEQILRDEIGDKKAFSDNQRQEFKRRQSQLQNIINGKILYLQRQSMEAQLEKNGHFAYIIFKMNQNDNRIEYDYQLIGNEADSDAVTDLSFD